MAPLTTRMATMADFPRVASLGVEFFQASHFRNWSFDFGIARRSMMANFEHPDVAILVAENSEAVVGFLIMDIQQIWTTEKLASFTLLWGKGASELVAHALHLASKVGVRGVTANNISGTSPPRLRAWRMLLLKHGFENIGGTMYKELEATRDSNGRCSKKGHRSARPIP